MAFAAFLGQPEVWRESLDSPPDSGQPDDDPTQVPGPKFFEDLEPGPQGDSGHGSEVGSTICSYEFRIPEDRMLGSFDTASIIINRMIGTGIFSTPSTIMKGTNSVGWSLIMWVLGGVVTLAGLYTYAELGMAIPRSGAEKLYLERIYRKPLYLMTCVVAIQTVFLGVSAANTVNFTKHFRMAIESRRTSDLDCKVVNTPVGTRRDWENKGISVAAITIVCIVHAIFPKYGILAGRFFSLFKLLTLGLIVICMVPALAGKLKLSKGEVKPHNFGTFNGKSLEEYSGRGLGSPDGGFRIALLQVLWAYQGWGEANRVLSEVDDPPKKFRKAIPVAVGTTTTLYIMANVAYFAALSKDEVAKAGSSVAVKFFVRILGCNRWSINFIPLCIAFSALGNVLAATFASARVKQELAKEGILPWSRFFAFDRPAYAPTGGIFLHWLFSVVFVIGPTTSDAYSFLSSLNTYSFSMIQFFVGVGLLYISIYPFWQPPQPNSKWYYSWYQDVENWKLDVERSGALRVWKWLTAVWITTLAYIVFVGCVPYDNKKLGIFPTLKWWLIPAVGFGVFFLGILYWVVWIHVWPRLGYAVQIDREVMDNGSERLVYRRIKTGGHRSETPWLRQQDEKRADYRLQRDRNAVPTAASNPPAEIPEPGPARVVAPAPLGT